MGERSRRAVIVGVALAAGVALGVSMVPTTASWLDKGGATMSVTAIEEPPPPVTGPVFPGNGTTFVGLPVWSGPNGAANPTPTSACFRVEIRTTSSTPVAWLLILETDQPPFNNAPPFNGFQYQLYGENASYNFTQAEGYATTGRYQVAPTDSNQYASLTQSYFAKICANTPEAAWQEPGPTTYTQTTLTLVRNGSQPCVAGTVVGHQPFFVGFTVAFNWKVFLDGQLAAGAITQGEYNQWINFKHWAGGPPGGPPPWPAQGATGTDFQTTLQGYQAESRTVSSIAPVTIASCSY